MTKQPKTSAERRARRQVDPLVPVSEGFGARLKAARERRNLSQHQLAVLVGVTNITVSRNELELAQPRRSSLDGYIRELHVSEEWLRFGHGEIEGPNAELVAQYLASDYGAGCSPEMAERLRHVRWSELGVSVPTLLLLHDLRMVLERHHSDP